MDTSNTGQAFTIKETSDMLGISTVRVHGLVAAGKLALSEQPLVIAGRFVKAITIDSIAVYKQQRKQRDEEVARNKQARAEKEKKAAEPRDGRKQYILTLSPEEIAELNYQMPGLELRPRFSKHKAESISIDPDERPADDEEWDGLPHIEQPVSETFSHDDEYYARKPA
jgi:hypothetical protein